MNFRDFFEKYRVLVAVRENTAACLPPRIMLIRQMPDRHYEVVETFVVSAWPFVRHLKAFVEEAEAKNENWMLSEESFLECIEKAREKREQHEIARRSGE